MFSNRTIGFYLGLAAGVMAIVSLVAYAMYAVAAGSCLRRPRPYLLTMTG